MYNVCSDINIIEYYKRTYPDEIKSTKKGKVFMKVQHDLKIEFVNRTI